MLDDNMCIFCGRPIIKKRCIFCETVTVDWSSQSSGYIHLTLPLEETLLEKINVNSYFKTQIDFSDASRISYSCSLSDIAQRKFTQRWNTSYVGGWIEGR